PSECLGNGETATPASHAAHTGMRTGNVKNMRDSTDATIQRADQMRANVLELQLCRGQLFGPQLGLESVDADAVSGGFRATVVVEDGFRQRCQERTQTSTVCLG